MPALQFDRDSMAKWYARQHLKTDPGVRAIHYLPTDAPEREIRFIEVNALIAELDDHALEPIDFGVDRGMDTEHRLVVLDVTPTQWERIQESPSQLPPGWSLKDAVIYSQN